MAASQAAYKIYLDTNILLHYPALCEIEWSSWCQTEKVCVTICMQVIHELDEKKNDSQLGIRAAKRIKEIKQLRLGQSTLKDRAEFCIDSYESRENEFPESLNPTSKDDRIIQSVLHFCENNPAETVVLVTEDIGMQIKCDTHKISYIDPPIKQRLPNPRTETEKKYRQAITELNELKNRQPKVIFSLLNLEDSDSSNKPLEFSLNEPFFDIEREMEFEKLLRRPDLNDVQIRYSNSGKVSQTQKERFSQIPEREQQEYIANVDQYLVHFRNWLIDNHEFEKSWRVRQIKFWVQIKNIGNAPDEDVDLYLDLPPYFSFICSEKKEKGKKPKKPERPNPPKPPVASGIYNVERIVRNLEALQTTYPWLAELRNMPYVPRIGSHFFNPRAAWDDIDGNAEKGYFIRIFQPRLNQHKSQLWGPYTLVFKSWEETKTFNIETRLYSVGAPGKIECKVPIIIHRG